MSLEITAVVHDRDFDVSLTINDGETVAVLGPNGAGKSTLLSVIAGLYRPDSGHATLGETTLFDVGRGKTTWLAPHARGVSMLTQEPLLFPHLSVLENVAFGPRSAGIGRAESRRRATEWLERVDASSLAPRRASDLSGGQAQRVAVARALAANPDLLLLDEPMAAMDASIRPALRRTLREVLTDRTAVIVTHDLLDALLLADRIIVIEDGRITDDRQANSVLERPVTPFAAGLGALNLLRGKAVAQNEIRVNDVHRVTGTVLDALTIGEPSAVAVPPSKVRLSVAAPTASEKTVNVLSDKIVDLEPRGDVIRVHGSLLAADLTPGDIARLDLELGTRVWFSFDSHTARVYPIR